MNNDKTPTPEELRGYIESDSDTSLTDALEELRGKDSTHNNELRSLVEKWRDAADDARTSGRVNDAQILNSCADELEGLIGED